MFSDVVLFGRTPLHWASENGHSNTVTLLLSYGGNIDVKDKLNEFLSLSLKELYDYNVSFRKLATK